MAGFASPGPRFRAPIDWEKMDFPCLSLSPRKNDDGRGVRTVRLLRKKERKKERKKKSWLGAGRGGFLGTGWREGGREGGRVGGEVGGVGWLVGWVVERWGRGGEGVVVWLGGGEVERWGALLLFGGVVFVGGLAGSWLVRKERENVGVGWGEEGGGSRRVFSVVT